MHTASAALFLSSGSIVTFGRSGVEPPAHLVALQHGSQDMPSCGQLIAGGSCSSWELAAYKCLCSIFFFALNLALKVSKTKELIIDALNVGVTQ